MAAPPRDWRPGRWPGGAEQHFRRLNAALVRAQIGTGIQYRDGVLLVTQSRQGAAG